MKKITYQMLHRYTNEINPEIYVGFWENEDHFYSEMRLDGHNIELIRIAKIEDATEEETANHSGMARYFEKYGTACE